MSGVIQKLASQVARPEGAFTAWIGANDLAIVDALAREAFDAVMLDMQHGGFDFVGAARGVAAAALAGKPALVRIPVEDFATGSRLVDAGAAGIIAPMINSAEDARRLADFLKYPPLGRRSWGPRACLPLSGLAGQAYLESANSFTLAIAMIETREAVDELDAILSTPGIDGVFVGPSDLSITLSGGRVDPFGKLVADALATIVERARANKKFAGLFCFDGVAAKAGVERGLSFCSIATDLLLLRSAAKAELAAARPAVTTKAR